MYKSFLYREIDKIMKNNFTNLFIRYYLIWIGSKGSKTGIHKDNDEQNLLLQIYGKKKLSYLKLRIIHYLSLVKFRKAEHH